MGIPYIGITDFMTYEQVEHMLEVFNKHLHLSNQQNRRLHVGVMMNYETLHRLPTKWSKAFPVNESIASIFQSSETMNCLHYADYKGNPIIPSLEEAIG
jgi:hypothetical protein